jgi:glycosidase
MPANCKPIIYQLVVRYFSNTNTTNHWNGSLAENGCGRFADISATALSAIRQLGVTHLWLTGCLRQATLTDYASIGLPPDDPDVVKGIAGSFYAIRDYFDVCPDYATDPVNRLAEFDSLVGRVHAAQMKVVLDFVPNHVARGYQSVIRPDLSFGLDDDPTQFFRPNNHFFYLVDPPGQRLRLANPSHWAPPTGMSFDGAYAREDGGPGRPPKATGNNVTSPNAGVSDWYETVKLNYGYDFVACQGHYAPRPRTWDTMDQVLGYWQARGVDGFRCDFAHYVPPEAWAFLIGQARQRDRHAFFFAEAYPFPGSGDPITDRSQLIDAGFDAVYHDDSYDRLKSIYQGHGGQDQYDQVMVGFSPSARAHSVEYLENHDERRLASPVEREGGPDASGFGSAEAGYQLAPLQFLYGPGPVLLLNGQEVGEPGAGCEGFGGDDGRTSLFDYWCMPEFAKWVNGHAYDGGGLSAAQRELRRFYGDLLAICQDACVRADDYWGLKYFNRPERFADCPADLYSFARFQAGAGRLLVVAANFRPNSGVDGRVRVPRELAELAALGDPLTVRLRLDRQGAQDVPLAPLSRAALIEHGFPVSIPNQTAHVYVIGSPV